MLDSQGDMSKMKEKPIFQLTTRGLAWYTLPLPIVAFIACVILSLVYDFEESTRTHCMVPNYLPTISAAIAGHTPQRYIWKICIALHSAPRLMLAIAYHNYYQTFTVHNQSMYSKLSAFNSSLHILENLCLVGLSYITSREDFTVHKFMFIGFILFSQIYMILSLVLFHWAHSLSGWSELATRSFRWKFLLAVINIGSFLLAMYFYWRHNAFCEPGVYTYFAVCEYLTISSNIGFNGALCYLDIGHYVLHISPVKTSHQQSCSIEHRQSSDLDFKLNID